jgi:DNA-binding NtrC family response regulator
MHAVNNRILVVDDDSEFRRSLTKILQKAGYEVSAAHEGRQASESIGHEFYPVILLDVHLPGKSGVEVLKDIKLKSPKSRVIIISVNGDTEMHRQIERLGVFAYLHKPVKREEILNFAKLAFA